MKRAAAILFMGTAVALAPVGHADHTMEDVGFLDTLNNYGIRYGDFADGDNAVIIGHAACELMDNQGYSPLYMAQVEQSLHHMTEADSEHLLGAAIGAFCPWDKI
jgi:hypothetical protein